MSEATPEPTNEELRAAAMLLASWVQRNGWDSFKWRGRVTSEGEAESFSLEVKLA